MLRLYPSVIECWPAKMMSAASKRATTALGNTPRPESGSMRVTAAGKDLSLQHWAQQGVNFILESVALRCCCRVYDKFTPNIDKMGIILNLSILNQASFDPR